MNEPTRPGAENPYVGPRTFQEHQAHLFFGRSQEAQDLISLVISEPLVLFHAPSGAGKSSLINTRLVPALRDEEGFHVLPVGRVGERAPGEVPDIDNVFVHNLLQKLNQDEFEPAALAHATMRSFLRRHRQHYRRPNQPLLLIIDQFEELVTRNRADWHHRRAFLRQLNQALQADPNLWVVLALRDDYVAAVDAYGNAPQGIPGARFHMERMGVAAALEAVSRPAALADPPRPFAPGVAEKLVNDLRQIRSLDPEARQLGEFVEPVQIQVVCYRLWERLAAREAAEITGDDLLALGDVDEALAEFYEQALANVIAATGLSELDLRNWFEEQLITENEMRAAVFQGAEETAGLANEAVHLMADQFLLHSEARAGGTLYELVHDRFVSPILHSNETWRQGQGPILEAATRWQRGGYATADLYDGAQLRQALASLDAAKVTQLVVEFLNASQAAERRRKEVEQARLAEAEAEAKMERERAEREARNARRLRQFNVIFGIGVVLVALLFLASVYLVGLRSREREASQRQIAAAQSTAVAAQAQATNVSGSSNAAGTIAAQAEIIAALSDDPEAQQQAQAAATEAALLAEQAMTAEADAVAAAANATAIGAEVSLSDADRTATATAGARAEATAQWLQTRLPQALATATVQRPDDDRQPATASFAKIGLHTGPGGDKRGLGDWMRRLNAAGIPVVLKAVDDYGPISEALAIGRANGVSNVLIYRPSTPGQNDGFDYEVPNYALDPVIAASIYWDRITASLPPEFDSSQVWLEILNEPNRSQVDWLGQFATHIIQLARAGDYKVALFGWAAGEPGPEVWQHPAMESVLRLAAAAPDEVAIALHEYSFDANDLFAAEGLLVGRFAQLYSVTEALGTGRPTVLISEFGWTFGEIPSPEEALEDIRLANELYGLYPEVLGATLWHLGELGGTNIDVQVNRLLEPLADFSLEWRNEAQLPATAMPGPSPTPIVLQVYDMSDDRGDVWQNKVIQTEGGRRHLGPFADDTVCALITGLDPHSGVVVLATLNVIGSWDGNYEDEKGDRFEVLADGQRILYTSFSQFDDRRQSYPGDYPDGDYPAGTGAAVAPYGSASEAFSSYQLVLSFPHTATSLELCFSNQFDPKLDNDERFELEDVRVGIIE